MTHQEATQMVTFSYKFTLLNTITQRSVDGSGWGDGSRRWLPRAPSKVRGHLDASHWRLGYGWVKTERQTDWLSSMLSSVSYKSCVRLLTNHYTMLWCMSERGRDDRSATTTTTTAEQRRTRAGSVLPWENAKIQCWSQPQMNFEQMGAYRQTARAHWWQTNELNNLYQIVNCVSPVVIINWWRVWGSLV